MSLNVVLIEPEIPQNTGNIARTCAATGTSLHLVKPLGFSVDDKYLKRAGLDYWHLLDINYYDNFEQLLNKIGKEKFFYATTKGGNFYTSMDFFDDAYLVFGKETAGIPMEILNANKKRCMRIPMIGNKDARSLNLATSAGIIIYEALRQIKFPNLV